MKHLRVVLPLLLVCAAVDQVAAQQLARLARGADEKDWEAHFDAGVAVLRTKPLDALASFEMAAQLDPTRAEPLFGQYVAFWIAQPREDYLAWRDGNEEQRKRKDVIRADSVRDVAMLRNPFVHRGLEVVMFDMMPGRFSTNRDTQAWLAYSTGNFARAEQVLTRTINRDPQRYLTQRYERALNRVMQQNLDGAREDLVAIVEELRRRESSAAELDYYLSKHVFLYMIGLIDVQRRDFAAARLNFAEAMLENAGFAYAQAAVANVSRVERKSRDAATEFATAIELAPTDPVLRWQYSQALFDAGRYDQAVAEATRAAEQVPQWAAPHLVVGMARERQGRNTQAQQAYETFVGLAPQADPTAQRIRQRLAAGRD
ncbi:MAG: tetratricopeptide repeat protein [Gemmatimonadaceae bacterium]|nr:tetratricopeptide repeat protein [Gemmatimonadaceae bacterium]